MLSPSTAPPPLTVKSHRTVSLVAGDLIFDRPLMKGIDPMNAKSLVRELLPRRHVAHRVMSGPLCGMKIVTSWHDYPAAILGYTERKLTDWLLANARPGETWLDVGANCGYTSLALSRAVGPQGRVFAFEPALTTAACLEQTGRVNGLTSSSPLPFALSESPRPVVSRFVTERGMIDSQLPPDGRTRDDGDHRRRPRRDLGRHRRRRHYRSRHQDRRAGHGTRALRGMRRLLSQHRPRIVLEIHRGCLT